MKNIQKATMHLALIIVVVGISGMTFAFPSSYSSIKIQNPYDREINFALKSQTDWSMITLKGGESELYDVGPHTNGILRIQTQGSAPVCFPFSTGEFLSAIAVDNSWQFQVVSGNKQFRLGTVDCN